MGRRGHGDPGLSGSARLMGGRRRQSGLILLLLVMSGCGGYNTYAPVRDSTSPRVNRGTGIYIVQRGDTLFSVAWQYGLEVQAVAAWNRISPPYTIYPGQKISLNPPPGRGYAAPMNPPSPPSTSAASNAARAPIRPAPPSAVAKTPSPTISTSVPQTVATGPVHWQWPATGPILRTFDGDSSGKKGVLIGGVQDSPVRAAASGWVVYAGSGLVGYGRLIILKHNDTYLSAYGHNRNLLVKEGDEVRSGQVIAHMGSSGTNRTQLHFEIRRNGKPVDPLSYLPRR